MKRESRGADPIPRAPAPGEEEQGGRRTSPPAESPWSSLPNRITALRIVALPGLWILAALREETWLSIGVSLAALTDVADGIIARRSGRTTSFGSRLDSVADHLLTASVALWLLWLRPEFFVRERVLLSIWIALGGLTLLAGWVRFRRIGGVHLYSAKAASVLGYLFAIGLLHFGDYSRWAFFGVIGIALLACLETLAIFLTRSRVDEAIGSILLPRTRSRRPEHRS